MGWVSQADDKTRKNASYLLVRSSTDGVERHLSGSFVDSSHHLGSIVFGVLAHLAPALCMFRVSGTPETVENVTDSIGSGTNTPWLLHWKTMNATLVRQAEHASIEIHRPKSVSGHELHDFPSLPIFATSGPFN
jgi:hypothetical protein